MSIRKLEASGSAYTELAEKKDRAAAERETDST
jgi:hypothetical protein